MRDTTDFTKKVIASIKEIPRGKVATYGQIARVAGKPQGSRGVAWILHSSSVTQDLPWHRVINSKGKISFPEMTESWVKQKRLLEKEGVEFKDGGAIDLKIFQWSRAITLCQKF